MLVSLDKVSFSYAGERVLSEVSLSSIRATGLVWSGREWPPGRQRWLRLLDGTGEAESGRIHRSTAKGRAPPADSEPLPDKTVLAAAMEAAGRCAPDAEGDRRALSHERGRFARESSAMAGCRTCSSAGAAMRPRRGPKKVLSGLGFGEATSPNPARGSREAERNRLAHGPAAAARHGQPARSWTSPGRVWTGPASPKAQPREHLLGPRLAA